MPERSPPTSADDGLRRGGDVWQVRKLVHVRRSLEEGRYEDPLEKASAP